MQLQPPKWQETGGSRGAKEQQQQQLTVSSGCWGIPSFQSRHLVLAVSTAIAHPLLITMHIFTEGSVFPLQGRLCLGDTFLCFNTKDVISARSTVLLPLAKWAALSAARARCCCENRYLCKRPCSLNDTSLKLLSMQWGFPASNGSFVTNAVITMTTTLLILADYCHVSCQYTWRKRHTIKQFQSQFIHSLFVAVTRKRRPQECRQDWNYQEISPGGHPSRARIPAESIAPCPDECWLQCMTKKGSSPWVFLFLSPFLFLFPFLFPFFPFPFPFLSLLFPPGNMGKRTEENGLFPQKTRWYQQTKGFHWVNQLGHPHTNYSTLSYLHIFQWCTSLQP